jgi:hypothetical protein
MRNVFYIVLLLFCQSIFCQEYVFDTLIEYSYSSTKKINEGTLLFMINSKNNGYVFFSNSNNRKSEGSIIDFNSKTQNCYKSTDENKFEYLCTQNILPALFFEKNQNVKFEFNKEDLNNNNSTILITKFKINPNGKKKIIDTIKIEIEKNNFVFNYNLLKFFSEKYLDDRDLSFLGDKTPKRIFFEYKYGFKRTFELNKIEKINTTLNITKEQINYKQ